MAVASTVLCLGIAVASAQTPATNTPGSDTSSTGSTGSSDRTTRDKATASPTYNSTGMASTDTNSGMDKNGMLKRSDHRFITKVAEGNEKEVAMAQLAAQRASSSEVRTYAQRLVSDHEKLKTDLAQLAQRKGITLESGKSMHHSGLGMAGDTETSAARASGAAGTADTPAGSGLTTDSTRSNAGAMASDEATSDRHYRSLAKKTGRDFDKEFVEMMVDDHKKDVKLFEKEAKDANDSDVRAFAASHLATLQAHLDQANSLSKSAAE